MIDDLPEKWKRVPGWPGYKISDMGNVKCRRFEEWTPCTQFIRGRQDGYKFVILRHARGGSHRESVHRLVLLAFVGPSDLPVNHKNLQKHDNRLKNLEYLTAKENCAHARAIQGDGEAWRGSRNTEAKLTEADIPTIRRLRAEGAVLREIAFQFHVSISTIRDICRKTAWTHVP